MITGYYANAGTTYSQNFQWFPCDVDIFGDSSKIVSYINNLHPKEHSELYAVVEKVIEKVLPLWNAILTTLLMRKWPTRIKYDALNYGDLKEFTNREGPQQPLENEEEMLFSRDDMNGDKYEDQREMVDLKKDFSDTGPQVIVKLINIHLTLENPKYSGGTWHVEGQLNERTCATAIYYYDMENITPGKLLTFINAAVGANIFGVKYSPSILVLDPVRQATCSKSELFGERRVVFVELRDLIVSGGMLSEWISRSRRIVENLKFSGIIYLHPIVEQDGVPVTNSYPPGDLNHLRDLCKEDMGNFPDRAIFVTTKWGKLASQVERDEAERAEKTLQAMWDDAGQIKCILPRFSRFEDSFESAWKIVSLLMSNHPEHSQRELDDLIEALSMIRNASALDFRNKDEVQCVVDLLFKIITMPFLLKFVTLRPIQALLLKLAALNQVFPSSLMLTESVEYDADNPVNGGGFGFIYQGTFGGHNVCVKTVRTTQGAGIEPGTTSQEAGKPQFLTVSILPAGQFNDSPTFNQAHAAELILMASISHESCFPLLGFCESIGEPGSVGIVLPWMENGDLATFIEENPECLRITLVEDIVQGLEYLHENLNIVHRDLKAGNVLVAPGPFQPKAMLADFGISLLTEITGDVLMNSFIGSINWMAPELLKMEEPPSRETDMWALGCTIYEVLSGEIPFAHYPTAPQLAGAMMRHRVVPQRPVVTSEQHQYECDVLWPEATKCWEYDPKKRPGAKEIFQHLRDNLDAVCDDDPDRALRLLGYSENENEIDGTEEPESMKLAAFPYTARSRARINADRAFGILRRECGILAPVVRS
ncbi:Putative L-type lectin-domain containing receptor kinase I.4 [Leucoagaricus sp. SymC.cos]|nr:Putative L-type lectin-domain containing receptor kinase I.4 [Leucoagaricus sp. SymC.cos]